MKVFGKYETHTAPAEKQDTECWMLENMQFSVDPESYHKKFFDPKAFEIVLE